MQGESDLKELLKNMQPYADEREFVFCSVDAAALSQLSITPIGLFREPEGTTLVLDKRQADKYALSYNSVWSLITLTVHSDLTAVGFLAAITAGLAKAGISVNVVSGYYHDHLFVPYYERERALDVLTRLSDAEAMGRRGGVKSVHFDLGLKLKK